MNSIVKTQITIAIPTTFTMTTGCATTGKDLVRDNNLKIEKVSSERATVIFAGVIQEGDEVMLRGEVRRNPNGPGPIPGHVDVEILDSAGSTLEHINMD